MAKSVVFACDVRGCDRSATVGEEEAAGQVCPPGWAVLEIVVKSSTPLPSAHEKVKTCAQTRRVLTCPDHSTSVLASLPGGSRAALPEGRR